MPTPLKQLIASQSADLCRCYGVRRLGLFGSVARGEERADSDIDFLVEIENLGPEHMADRYFGFIEDATRRFVTGGANSDCFWRLKSHLR